jgi:hypothetical protein
MSSKKIPNMRPLIGVPRAAASPVMLAAIGASSARAAC